MFVPTRQGTKIRLGSNKRIVYGLYELDKLRRGLTARVAK